MVRDVGAAEDRRADAEAGTAQVVAIAFTYAERFVPHQIDHVTTCIRIQSLRFEQFIAVLDGLCVMTSRRHRKNEDVETCIMSSRYCPADRILTHTHDIRRQWPVQQAAAQRYSQR